VIGKEPVPVGVPESTPVGLRVTPLGRLPETTVNVTGELPPTACTGTLNASPTTAPGRALVVIASVAKVLTLTGPANAEQPDGLHAWTRY
jgi:hypothetical protein